MSSTNVSLILAVTAQRKFNPNPPTPINDISYLVVVVISIIGLIGNGISIAILRKHNFAETSNIFVLTLCVNDLILSFVRCINTLGKYFTFSPLSIDYAMLNSVATVVECISTPVGVQLSGVGLLITSMIALKRLIAVCFPFHVSRIFTTTRVRGIIVFLYLLHIAAFSPRIFQYALKFEYSKIYNKTVAVKYFSDIYAANPKTIETYLETVCNNILLCICLSIILISTVTISVKLVRRNMHKITTTDSTKKRVDQNKIIKMLITICLITFITFAAAEVVGILLSISKYITFDYVLADICYSMYGIIFQAHSSINFIVYICMSKKFKSQFIHKLTWLPRLINIRIVLNKAAFCSGNIA